MKPMSFIALTRRGVSRVRADCSVSTMPRRMRGEKLGHGTKVQEHQRCSALASVASAGQDEQVSGVRIGVIDAIAEDLLAVRGDDGAGQR